MKKYLFLIMLFTLVSIVFAQNSPSLLWSEFYGGDHSDGFDCIIETSDGNLLMSGYNKLTSGGWYNIFIVKTDTDGVVEWEQCYPFNRHTRAIQIIETSNGDFLLLVEVDNQEETWLMKVDSLGNELWIQEYIGYEWPKSIVEADNNEFILIGDRYDTDFQPFWILRVDGEGVIVWIQLYNRFQTGLDIPTLISLINNDNEDSDGYLLSGYNYNYSLYETFLIRVNEIGEIEWYYMHETNHHNNTACNIIQDENEFLLWIYGQDNNWVVAIDENGNYVNSTIIESPYNFHTCDDFIFTQNHGYIFLGSAFFGYDNRDFALFQTNVFGELDWYGHYDLASYEQPSSLALLDSNDLYVVGISEADTPSYSSDGFLSKLQMDNSPICDYLIHNDFFNISNYPNPFNPTTTIELSIQNDSVIDLSIYNIKGQKIKTLVSDQFTVGQHSIIWNGDNESGHSVSSGIYYYKLNINGETEAVRKCLLMK
ncbi:MAG: T9SS type A sorting domain-containing protein [Candidatus Cloacimonadota bacterium]|nr:T9SS type A sorting domain-containing protein [Candidatus Cloacimonadota bacterium]